MINRRGVVVKISIILIVVTAVALRIFFIKRSRDINNSESKINQELIGFVTRKVTDNCYSNVKEDICKNYHYVVVVDKNEGNFAQGHVGIEGGAGWLWAATKKNGKWDYLSEANGFSDCKDVEIFPVGIFGNNGLTDECIKDNKLFDRSTGKFVN